MPVSRLPERGRVLCHGMIESVTYMPADQIAAFTAIVTDTEEYRRGAPAEVIPGTPASVRRRAVSGRRDRLRVIWLGRRRVPGIQAGTELRLEGMLTLDEGLPTIFNPRYEILSRQENE
ncbi:hypothetical protein [Pseudarthrobacter sp. N5]|uniref:hypothetical protein n=1 Tax=Pseudarthrobacter sp. N5 TaxID=3418416 RepID=UPI003CEA15DF